MPIENHVTSLEISKRLKELGVAQNTIFSWKPTIKITVDGTYKVYMSDMVIVQSCEIDHINKREIYSAFLASEITEISPEWGDKQIDAFADKNEANRRAKMLVYLLEKRIIKPGDLKKC